MTKPEIGSDEWLEMRRNYITASDAPVILGHSPFKTAFQLYCDKINGTQSKKTAAMQRGLDLEPDAKKCFELLTGHQVVPEWRTHPSISWMAATFDGINDNGVVLEIKCPGSQDHNTALQGVVPAKYMAQLQHQMLVADVSEMFYLSYRPNDFEPSALIEVRADLVFQEDMLKREEEFWLRLQSRTPPDVTDTDIVLKSDAHFLLKEEELFNRIQRHKENEERIEALKDELIALCNSNPTKGYRLKFIPVSRKGNVNYSAIPSLKNVDLEQYRKPGTTHWRVDLLS